MEILSINRSIQQKLEEADNLFEKHNKNYYLDVLDFLNLLFENDSKVLTKIKFKKITLNDNIFLFYNYIIKNYNLNKPEFDKNFFDISNIDDKDELKQKFYETALYLSNNLLEKINYKLKKIISKYDNKIKFILEYIK